jgi:hypothetical protein
MQCLSEIRRFSADARSYDLTRTAAARESALNAPKAPCPLAESVRDLQAAIPPNYVAARVK